MFDGDGYSGEEAAPPARHQHRVHVGHLIYYLNTNGALALYNVWMVKTESIFFTSLTCLKSSSIYYITQDKTKRFH